MNQNFTKFAFTDSVKKLQEESGSREAYARVETSGDNYLLTEREISFIASRDSFYMATVGENGWPYVQFRGGEPGFLKLIDDTNLDVSRMTGDDIREVADASARRNRVIGTGKFAIFTPNDLEFGMNRMWQAYVEDQWDADIYVARARDDALAWLAS